jgi:hypothetical protein
MMSEDGTARAVATAHDATVKTLDNASVGELEAAVEAAREREAHAAYAARVVGAERKLERAKAEVAMHEQELVDAKTALAERDAAEAAELEGTV